MRNSPLRREAFIKTGKELLILLAGAVLFPSAVYALDAALNDASDGINRGLKNVGRALGRAAADDGTAQLNPELQPIN